MPGFFETYPEFARDGELDYGSLERMNARHDAVISAHLEHIRGKRILDLGSHDGRWSLAALRSGASYVRGLEVRPELVERARDHFRHHGVDSSTYDFEHAEVAEHLASMAPGEFDTVFCLGLLYLFYDHLSLLKAIRRLEPAAVIFDTWVIEDEKPVIEIGEHSVAQGTRAVSKDQLSARTALTGTPSCAALELFLKRLGYRWQYYPWQYYPWQEQPIAGRNDLNDYFLGGRVTLVAIQSRETGREP